MEFNFINGMGAMIVTIMLLPNILYALKKPQGENRCHDRRLLIMEQFGRYACIVMMVLPLGIREFGFPNVLALIIYLLGNTFTLLGYLMAWLRYWQSPDRRKAILLAILPVALFLISGITLHHWWLAGAAVLFGYAHLNVTLQNHEE